MMRIRRTLKLLIFIFILGFTLNSFGFGQESISYFGAELDDDWSWISQIIQQILNIWYIIIWPLLVVGWHAMDNSLVYGSIIHMDQYLWQMWNIMKNFANFALWFIFFAAIFLYFFNVKQDKFSPKKFLPKLLLGAFTIQASWFIVAALIDISTILTYSMGNLPLNIIQWDEHLDRQILMQNSISDIKNFGKSFGKTWTNLIWYSDEQNNYLPCTFERKEWDYYFSGDLFENIQEQAEYLQEKYDETWLKWNLSQDCVIQLLWNRLVQWPNEDTSISSIMGEIRENPDYWKGVGINISEFVQRWKWFTWVFSTLFGSFLGSSTLPSSSYWITSDTDAGTLSAILILKFIIAIALLVPLLVLIIILIIRIFLLWILIAFSPIMALIYSFDFSISEKLWKYSLSNFLWLIFLPAIVVFALSIGLIFMTVLTESIWKDLEDNPLDIWIIQWNETKESCWEIKENFPTMCFAKPNDSSQWFSVFLDYFSWIIINIFGIAVIWAVVFAALKTSKITSGVADFVQSYTKSLSKTAPVIPWWHSLGSLEQFKWRIKDVPWDAQRRQYWETIWPYMQWIESRIRWEDNSHTENQKSDDEGQEDDGWQDQDWEESGGQQSPRQ